MTDILHHRARIGALSRSRPDDDPELVGAKQALAEAKMIDFLSRCLAVAPPLSDETLARVAELLRPVHGGA